MKCCIISVILRSTWYVVPGARYLVPGTRYESLPNVGLETTRITVKVRTCSSSQVGLSRDPASSPIMPRDPRRLSQNKPRRQWGCNAGRCSNRYRGGRDSVLLALLRIFPMFSKLMFSKAARISECHLFTCGPVALGGKPSGTSGVFSDGMATLVSVYTLQALPMPRAAYLLASCQQTIGVRICPV